MTPSKKEKKVGKKGKPGKESEGSPEAGDAPHDNTVAPETIIKPRKAVSLPASSLCTHSVLVRSCSNNYILHA